MKVHWSGGARSYTIHSLNPKVCQVAEHKARKGDKESFEKKAAIFNGVVRNASVFSKISIINKYCVCEHIFKRRS